jgi:hypothetical protein
MLLKLSLYYDIIFRKIYIGQNYAFKYKTRQS